jgi:hypothetical protein
MGRPRGFFVGQSEVPVVVARGISVSWSGPTNVRRPGLTPKNVLASPPPGSPPVPVKGAGNEGPGIRTRGIRTPGDKDAGDKGRRG